MHREAGGGGVAWPRPTPQNQLAAPAVAGAPP